jgi:hypothetical protein
MWIHCLLNAGVAVELCKVEEKDEGRRRSESVSQPGSGDEEGDMGLPKSDEEDEDEVKVLDGPPPVPKRRGAPAERSGKRRRVSPD